VDIGRGAASKDSGHEQIDSPAVMGAMESVLEA
jgi:hypothetical protein